MFCTCVVYFVCLLLCKEEGSSAVYLQLLRGGIWTMLANSIMCGIILVFKSSFQHDREECERAIIPHI